MAFKYTSETFTIRARVVESAANTFTQAEVGINLDSLSREILVIHRVDMDPQVPDNVAATYTAVEMTLANTSQAGIVNIDNADCIASSNNIIVGGVQTAVGFSEHAPESITASADPLYIVATDNLFLGIKGLNNGNAKAGYMVMHCRRARADSGTYAAILTSQFA